MQDEELVEGSLPDKRLEQRLRRLLDQMSAAPGQPIPAACGDWAATKAAYRFFDNPRVTEHGVLAGHFAATGARCAASEGTILILQDTTEFIYNRAQPGKIGFTKTINGGQYKAGQPNAITLCGVLMHSSLAITLAGTPLGLTAMKFWTRTKFKGTLALKRHINPTRDRIDAARTRPRLHRRTLAAYVLEIATLGGYLARNRDPPPGNMVVWRGVTRLHDIAFGISIGSHRRCG